MVRLPKNTDHTDTAMSLASNVKQLRLKRGMSQTELASAIDASYSRISEIENGKGNPTLRTLEAIAKVFGVAVGTLLKESREVVNS